MKIEVLGSCCSNCDKLLEQVKTAVSVGGLEAEVVKNTEMEALIQHQVAATPALVVDGQLISSGKVLKSDEILQMLRR